MDTPASDNFLHYSIGPWDSRDLEGFFDGIIGGLIRHKPLYLIKTYPDLDLDVLQKITGLQYRLVKVVLCRFPIYRLVAMRSLIRNPLSFSWQEKMQFMKQLTESDWHAPGIDRSDLQQGRMEIALKECRKLLYLNPHDINGLIFLGELYDLKGLPEQSAPCFEKVLHEAPYIPEVRVILAKQCIELNRFAEAESHMAEETRRFGEKKEMAFYRGQIQQRKGNHKKALAWLERFRSENPERHDCWQALIQSLIELKDQENLLRLYTEAERIKSKQDRQWLHARITNALATANSGRQPEYETIDHFIQRDPDNRLLLYAKASALERAGKPASALQLFEEVANSNTYDNIRAAAWFRLARLSPDEAKEELARRCLELDPEHSGAKGFLNNSDALVSTHEKAARAVQHE
jgi:tetratricopeptide (TPR) repeat protein